MDQPQSRDETAFSVDASTGAPSAPLADITRASVAMKALDLEHVDQAGYHELLEDDAAFDAYVGSDAMTEHDPASGRTETVFRRIAEEAAARGDTP